MQKPGGAIPGLANLTMGLAGSIAPNGSDPVHHERHSLRLG